MQRVAATAIGATLLLTCWGNAPAAEPTPEEIQRWIADLDDDRFSVREAGTKSLIEAGTAVIPALVEQTNRGSLEVSCRTVRVLQALADGDNLPTREAALAALRQIADTPGHTARRRAAAMLLYWETTRRERIFAEIRRFGGTVAQQSDGQQIVRIGKSWQGGREGLAFVRRLDKLPSLSLEHSSLPDDALQELAGMANLRRLYLGESQIEGPGLRRLAGLDSLTYLSLKDLKLDDDALEHIGQLANLDHLGLDGTSVTDAALEHLKPLERLAKLWLNGTRITDAGLVHLGGLTQIAWLDLSDTRITDAGIEHLGSLPKLEELRLQNTALTDGAIEHLAELKALKRLHLQGTTITDVGIAKLRRAMPQISVTK